MHKLLDLSSDDRERIELFILFFYVQFQDFGLKHRRLGLIIARSRFFFAYLVINE